MILVPLPASWVSKQMWACLLSLMNSYFTMKTVDVLSEVDVAPIAKYSQRALYVSSNLKAPLRAASVDAVLIARSLGEIDLSGRYARLVVVSEDLNSVLPLWGRLRLLNTVVLMANTTHVNAYTWFPYMPETCHLAPALELMDSCAVDRWTRDLYPNKLPQNFGGCPIYYKTVEFKPDIVELPDGRFIGREITFMEILAESRDLSVRYRPSSRDHAYPFPIGNTAMALIMRGEADIAFGTMVLITEYGKYAATLPTFREHPVVWMLPRAWPQSPTSGIYSGFSKDLWLEIVAVICVSGVLLACIAHVESQRWRWLDLVSLLVASPIPPPSSTFMKMFLVLLQIYSMHIAWFYQAVLLGNLFSPPMERQLTNAGEATETGLVAIMYPFLRMFFGHSKETWEKVMTPGRHNFSVELPYERVVDERSEFLLALLVNDGYAMRLRYRRNLSSMVYIHPFVNNPVVAYGIRNSPVTDLFSIEMLHLIESGIYWHLSSLEKGYYDLPSKEENSGPQVLGFEPLKGAFIMLACNIGLTLFAFIGEILIGHRKTGPL